MKKRWLLVLVAVTIMIVFPIVSLAGGGVNQVRLEGGETPGVDITPTPTPVETPVSGPTVKLDKHSVTLVVGETATIHATTSPEGLPVSWSYNGDGFRFDLNGEIYWTFAPGTGTITVKVGATSSDTCVVTIIRPKVTRVELPYSTYSMSKGDSIGFGLVFSPSEAETFAQPTWMSSNSSIFKVDEVGMIRALDAGTATLTVTVDGVSDACLITVMDPNALPTPTLTPSIAPTSGISATPRPPSSASAASTPGPTRGVGESGGPQPTRVPVQLDTTGWEAAEEAISGMEPGSLGSIPTPEDTLVPASLLQTLKQTQCALEIDMGGYTCTIDGADLAEMPDCMEPIDIGMTMEKDVLLSAECGGNAYELRFNYHGELPGVFTFRVKADGSRPGDTIYVYFYNEEADVYESHVAATVDEQGYVSFGITHCSSYCITSEMIPDALNNFELPTEATEKPDAESTRGFAAFVEDNYIAFWVCVYALGCAVVVITFVVIFHRRGKKRTAGQQAFIKQ